MAQIQINGLNVETIGGTSLSEIKEFREIYSEMKRKVDNPIVWLRKVSDEAGKLLTPNEQGAFSEEVENGDVIMIEEVTRYGDS